MSPRRKIGGLAVAAIVVFATAGCGGRQNPWKVHTGVSNWLVNGVWDGFVAIPLLVSWLFGPNYRLYASGATALYGLCWIVGIVLFLALLFSLIRRVSLF